MIAFLEGVIAGKTLASVYLNVGGVGFEVGMSQAGLSKLPQVGEQVLVHTYLQVRDDGMSLFGFLSLEEKALFEKLITVSGVGPKVALAALSSYTPFSSPNIACAKALHNSVLPTPVGPRKINEPTGLFGSFNPTLPRRIALETAVTASS